MKKIVVAFGTRPEVIKLAPVIRALKSSGADIKILHTGQHVDLAAPLFKIFEIKPDIDLNVMRKNQDLFDLSSSILPAAGKVLKEEKPDAVIIQGDTTSAYLTALAAYYLKIPVFHVEAGLRSHDPYYPFPEEMNRKLISQIASMHFAPTHLNEQNLKNEGISQDKILITGNTIIDALNFIRYNKNFMELKPALLNEIDEQNKLIILTAHRRENHGKPLHDILSAVNELVQQHNDLMVIYPAHPSPAVRESTNHFQTVNMRLKIIEPLDYTAFLHLMMRSDLILTDSGGIQEEASALAKPVVVLRNETEREELIESGLGALAGTNKDEIVRLSNIFLQNETHLGSRSLYGDGTAAMRIAEKIAEI